MGGYGGANAAKSGWQQGWIRAHTTLESTFLRSTHKNSSDGW